MFDQPPQTAAQLGLMQGFPPAADRIVTHANQLYGPYNRWSFQHELALNRTVDMWRGCGPVAAFEHAPRDLSGVTYQNLVGDTFSFDDMIERSYTDAIVVLHGGKLIYERYLNGMQPHSLHAWASGSKSLTGVLAVLLAHEGAIDRAARVDVYLPELHASGFGDATVQQVLDMTTAVRFRTNTADGVIENDEYGVALGWRTPPDDYTGTQTVYDVLPTMIKDGAHGERFAYLTPNTDVLAWIIKRVLNQTLADAMRERIWSKLGAERDAFWIVGPAAVETAGSGLVTTARDMARIGQMLLDRGVYNEEQIVPAAAVDQITRGGDPAAFARGPAASPGNAGWSYGGQWWHTHNMYGAYLALGYGGQILYVAPGAQLVVAKMSSYPTPTPAGNEFYAAFAALPALAKALAE